MTLNELKKGETSIIKSVNGTGPLRQHFLDMGLIPGAEITLTKLAPLGDPMELMIHGYELTLRLSDAENIEITDPIPEEAKSKDTNNSENIVSIDNVPPTLVGYHPENEHPGFGEGGIHHDKSTEHPIPDDVTLTFALAGNQNAGKTTLFNQLTGSNQHVGNFPGVTVDKKSGVIRGHNDTDVTDLPGIYSLSPYSSEELVSRQFILEEKPMGIINIVDASNIERNLYLTMQLMELDIPMVLALNMIDEVRGNGGSIRVNEMENALGIPVVPISALKNEGIDELIDHAYHVTKYQETPLIKDFCDKNEKGGAVHRCIHSIMHTIEDHAEKAGIPIRFAASKIIEGDSIVLESLNLSQNEIETIEHLILQLEEESGLDRAAAIADMRFDFIQRLCKDTVVKPKESKEHKKSRKIDKILTGKFTAIPCFILVMAAIFFLTFNVIGAFLQYILELGINYLTDVVDNLLTSMNVNESLHALITEGIFVGVGSVVSFVPIIVVLFFFLSLLEDSGYMARVAFVMDKLLRRIGLSGKSIVPMLIGFGCTVPAVMSSRTLSSERDRKMTIMLTPFMSCSAKLPIYGFLANAFFPKISGLIMVAVYFIGIIIGIIIAKISNKIAFKGSAVPFVMELPNYRLPGLKNVGHLLWDKAKDFLQRAFTIILLGTIIVWVLKNFDIHFNLVKNASESILAVIASVIAPIFEPMGCADYRIITSLVSGFLAKESVVSTFTVLFGPGDAIAATIGVASGSALLIFCLLYTPCVAAIASIRRELGRLWALGIALGQCVIAWLFGVLVYQIILLFL
ncbi:MAG: ferrous iron transport protein B [Lachnospiraceae bacterium]|nr:ferrous iron transport protein B [Lachnospiraceae bacterium]